MKTYKLQEFVVRGKEIFVGLEDSKKTWKLYVLRTPTTKRPTLKYRTMITTESRHD